MNKHVFVLALDGTPFSLLNELMDLGIMPNFKQLVNEYNFSPMNSVHPPISSVAWTSFVTGKNPAGHNIYGFIEREPETMEVFVPTSVNIKAKTIWKYLSEYDKKIFTMNVPVTYPPNKINGIMICGFLCTDILKGTYPTSIAQQLVNSGYRIDVDTIKARSDLFGFIEELNYVLDKRFETILKFYDQENWDFFMAHIMETDRLHHFVWELKEKGDSFWTEQFHNIYKKVDDFLGILLNELQPNSELLMLSDHGFTTLKKEVYINKWLYDNQYLKFNPGVSADDLSGIHRNTRIYSLIPGRMYVNLKGREKSGSVSVGVEYESLREEIKHKLQQLIDPETGEKVVQNVITREECYRKNKIVNQNFDSMNVFNKEDPFYYAPDLIIVNEKGFDFKGNLWMDKLFSKGPILGTHTFDNAFLMIKDRKIDKKIISIMDMLPTIFELLDLEMPQDLDGTSVLQN